MSDRIVMHSSVKDVPLAKMKVSGLSQRDLRPARVNYLTSEFDPEQFGYPVVNMRDGFFWVIDGQHRIEAVKLYLGDDWAKQSVTCRVYTGLTEQEEAEMFDRLNNQLTVGMFDKFKVRVTAGRQTECAVQKIVEKSGLKISRSKGEGSISAVGTLVKVYDRAGATTLHRALILAFNSFGDPGLSDRIIDGMARVCERYNGALDDDDAIERFKTMRGGVGALMQRAETLRKQVGASVPQCVAAAIVDTLNAKRGGKKIPSWWKE